MTTEKQIIDVPGLFDACQLGFVQCITAGSLIFVAGQTALDEQLQIVSTEFDAQARHALLSVRRALQAAGADVSDITAVTVYLTDMANLAAFSAVRQEVFGDVLHTSTAVGVTALARPGLLVEVTVMAVRT